MKISMGNGSVSIDGRTFSGRSVVINGDQVVVDGVVQEGALVGPISVVVTGDAESIEMGSGSVDVTGSVGRVKTISGNVRCGEVSGDVGTISGDFTCPAIAGNVKTTSGDIIGRSK
ncbi:hypothetical protein [Pseudomonas gingeri]|uniref:hypothetical protein n=1 Tax=Pseudomonas gingeri TaxID=117681 RepID=UPI0015A2A464|nr:hypothetical protein [Pseudomonas gingeri]NWA11922.1 hypothetical protein [Pseudomonas gingeri]